MNSTPDFNRLAGAYRWLEYCTFGPYLHRARIHFLPQLSHCRSALVLGDGDGRFTAALLDRNPSVRVHAVDISVAMLRRLTRRAGHAAGHLINHADHLITEQADLRRWNPPALACYDVVVAHFFLDCLTTAEIADLARRLGPSTTAGTLWLVSDFAIPANGFGHLFAAPLVGLLYCAFGLLTGLRIRHLPDYAIALSLAGWTLRMERKHLNGLLVSQLWQARDEMKTGPAL
jgi:hypothetical protein